MNLSPKPDKLTAAVIDDAPGTVKTLWPFSTHAFIMVFPGSDKTGVPASEIKDKILPSFKYFMILLSDFFSLNL